MAAKHDASFHIKTCMSSKLCKFLPCPFITPGGSVFINSCNWPVFGVETCWDAWGSQNCECQERGRPVWDSTHFATWILMYRRKLLIPSSGYKVWSSRFRRKIVKYLWNYSTSRPKQKRNLEKQWLVSESNTNWNNVTEYREQNSTLEANRYQISQEMFLIWSKPTAHRSIYNCKSLFHILSKMKTTHALELHSHHNHFNIIFSSTCRFSKQSLSFGVASLETVFTSVINLLCHMPRLCRRPLFEHLNNFWAQEAITKAEICTFFYSPLLFLALTSKYCPPALSYWTP